MAPRAPQVRGGPRPGALKIPSIPKAPDPIDESAYPGTVEGDAKAEADQIQAGFRERMAAEADRFQTATEGDYYSVVMFASGEQCRAFCAALGQDGGLFIDGRVLADRLGIELPPAKIMSNPSPRIDPKLAKLVRKPAKGK
jgi:hypothetical protein